MNIEAIRAFFAWCTVINMVLLLWWFLVFILARDRIYRYHKKWFQLSEEQFAAIHYGGMGLFKIWIFLFNLAPYLALRIIG